MLRAMGDTIHSEVTRTDKTGKKSRMVLDILGKYLYMKKKKKIHP